ncbi:Imm1 family immunity protein [Streptomyces fimicarius]|uniref:Imm1 family immunity protein n=1 Tax=Streptomyces griseus TaxID=1911 RepID=UPI0036C651F7
MTTVQVEAFYRAHHLDAPDILTSAEDVDRMLDLLASGEKSETMASLYSKQRENLASGFPDHEFLVGVDRERGVGIVAFSDEVNYFPVGQYRQEGGDVEYCFTGNPREFPAGSEIPIALVRDAVVEFLLTGGKRPECIKWREG